jgi:hypothetical protein
LWLNLASSLCPAFGIVRRTGSHADSSRGIPLFTGAQSNTFGSQYSHILNGEFDVNEGEWGEVQTGEYLIARYRPADGAPAIGDRVGPRNGSWEMRLNTGGFVVEELIDTTTDFLIRVRRAPMLDFYGKNAGSQISRGSTGTINIYAGVYTSEADTGETMTGVLAKFGAIAAGAKVQCRLPDTANGTTAAIGWFAYETDTCPT